MTLKQKILDAAWVLLVLGMGVIFFRLLWSNHELSGRVESQAAQTSTLIGEIGEAKEENEMLFQKLRAAEIHLSRINPLIAPSPFAAPKVLRVAVASEANTVLSDDISRGSAEAQQTFGKTRNFLIVGHNRRLADTILAAIVKPGEQEISLVSIPRDLFVNGRKINEYLALYGIRTLSEKVSEVTGLFFEGHVVLDFRAFQEIIDAFGGIKVEAEKAIYDPLYPNGTGGYTVYSLAAGTHHMNGTEALRFARSRHSTSDFDRAARQQKILRALLSRARGFDFLKNFGTVKDLFASLSKNMETDVGLVRGLSLLMQFRGYRMEEGTVFSTANLLYPSISLSGQYILLPKGGLWDEVRGKVAEMEE